MDMVYIMHSTGIIWEDKMSARSAEVKSYVLPGVKSGAQAVYARWGMSLSDAVNTLLI